MPKLLIFAPCTSVMMDVLNGRWSVGSLIEAVLPMPLAENKDDPEYPKYMVEPILFFALWWCEPSDGLANLEQYIEMISPLGKVTTLVETVGFELAQHYHRVLQRTAPIGVSSLGIYQAVLKARPVGTEEWIEYARYPIQLQPVMVLTPDQTQPVS
ncbi:MAG: hypothetical protein JWL77_56 [Chthonomonadaceae bacterium]|nr:hypothetical protein [Chthonomonadaceae bacterium]